MITDDILNILMVYYLINREKIVKKNRTNISLIIHKLKEELIHLIKIWEENEHNLDQWYQLH